MFYDLGGLITSWSWYQPTQSSPRNLCILPNIKAEASVLKIAGPQSFEVEAIATPGDMNTNAIYLLPSQDDIPDISTNIFTDKTSDVKTASPKAVYDAIDPACPSVQPVTGMLPNLLYEFGELAGDTTFLLNTTDVARGVNHYFWTFETPATAPTITWPAGLTWQGGSAPTINASKHYEISVLNGIAIALEV